MMGVLGGLALWPLAARTGGPAAMQSEGSDLREIGPGEACSCQRAPLSAAGSPQPTATSGMPAAGVASQRETSIWPSAFANETLSLSLGQRRQQQQEQKHESEQQASSEGRPSHLQLNSAAVGGGDRAKTGARSHARRQRHRHCLRRRSPFV